MNSLSRSIARCSARHLGHTDLLDPDGGTAACHGPKSQLEYATELVAVAVASELVSAQKLQNLGDFACYLEFIGASLAMG